jgi:mono/diheme cytochrome c family protein
MGWGCGGADSSTTLADAGIGSGDGSTTAAVAPGMRALLDRRCVGCHQPGGTGRGDYTIDDEVLSRRLSIGTAVAARTMPPWMPDPSCGSFDGDLSLSDAELALVADWAAGGEPATSVSPVTSPLPDPGPPQRSFEQLEPYVPVPEELTDRLATHLLGQPLMAGLLLRGVAFRVSRPEIVHHLQLYAAPAESCAPNPEAGPGAYTCAPETMLMVAAAIQLSSPFMLPSGTAVSIPSGYRFVLEVHYNIAALPRDTGIPAVVSGIDVWTSDIASSRQLTVDFVAADDFVIPAGEARGISSRTIPIERPSSVSGILPHMHIFGTAFYASLVRADGSEECIVSIPDWRFLEQRVFFRPPGEEITLAPGDSIKLRCEYDNSYVNQPTVRGVRSEPRDLVFGWLSTNEMCQLNLLTVTP